MCVSECVYVSVYESVMSFCVCVEYTEAITMESVGGSVAKHSNLMKKVKCCHFNHHSVYHVVKILIQVEPERRKSSGVKV